MDKAVRSMRRVTTLLIPFLGSLDTWRGILKFVLFICITCVLLAVGLWLVGTNGERNSNFGLFAGGIVMTMCDLYMVIIISFHVHDHRQRRRVKTFDLSIDLGARFNQAAES